MEFDIELNWDHITISFLDKHSNLVVYYVGLSCLIVTKHELRMLVSNQLRHEVLDAESLNIFISPPKKHSEAIVRL